MTAYPPEITLDQALPLMTPMTRRFAQWVIPNDGLSESEALEMAWDRTDDADSDDREYNPRAYRYMRDRSDAQRMADGFGTWGESYADMLHDGEYTIPW